MTNLRNGRFLLSKPHLLICLFLLEKEFDGPNGPYESINKRNSMRHPYRGERLLFEGDTDIMKARQ